MRSLLGLLLCCISFSAIAASPDQSILIKVRVQKSLSSLSLSGAGLRVGPSSDGALEWGRREVRLRSGGWEIVDPKTNEVFRTSGGELTVSGGDLRAGTQALPNRLRLLARHGVFDVIAVLDLREYLSGVVAHEMPTQWPLETLKAQAVAARSYALAVRNARRDRAWHLESTIADQVFFVDRTRDLSRSRRAVIETDGVTLTLSKKILKAFYHADCGGRTVPAATVWAGENDAGVAIDSQCPSSAKARWRWEASIGEVSRRFGGWVSSLELGETAAGRWGSLWLTGENGKRRKISANEFRLAMGSTELKSASFELQLAEGKIVLKGKGFGHGVGMCQWGSRSMGLKGADSKAILSHYYPKARLARLEAEAL